MFEYMIASTDWYHQSFDAFQYVNADPHSSTYREVDDGGLGGDLGRVVRVAQLGRDVEPEVLAVVQLLVTQPDNNQSPLSASASSTLSSFSSS
jgi:hypothetical protein